ncbi:MAG TPA: PDZ domain-containing protein [Verrucomicrobiae bacterium]|nr:PDZ domain-containing protein [Verrucomicrobiae bacterium]
MRTEMKPSAVWIAALFMAGLAFGPGSRCLALPPRGVVEEMLSNPSTTGASASASAGADKDVQVSIEAESDDADENSHEDVAWLGVSTVEASEALSSQLELTGGVGLVVTYVAHESGAAKAGLQKHDVLVQFDDQSLVHPAQLRKLVRAHKPGETVQLAFYRSGKRQSAAVTLGKLSSQFGETDEGRRRLQEKLSQLQGQLKDLHIDVAIQNQMNAAREALGKIKLDPKKVQDEIRESMEQARRAVREALRNATNSDSVLNPVRKILDDLAGTSVVMGNNTTVTVKSSGKEARSLVKADESGTIVLIANPKLHLTAHDKDGKLLFDGEIQTSEQRDKVPHELWERVEPLLDKMNANSAAEAETSDKP